MKFRGTFFAALALTIFATSAALSQDYPTRPIRVVVPFAPGAAVDVTARLVQQPMSEALGQPFVIENRTGATGMIGAEFVARSAPDGYTLLYMPGSGLALRKFVSKAPVPDILTDFTPIASTVELSSFIVVGAQVPVNSMAELLAYTKANPGKLNYGTAGVASTQHLTGEVLKQHGVDMVAVPFQGLAQAMTSLLSGHIEVGIFDYSAIKGALQDGKLKALGVTSPQRHHAARDIPTVAEAIPGFEMPSFWMGLFGPAGLPDSMVERLNAEVTKALKAPDVAKRLNDMDLVVIPKSTAEMKQLVRYSVDAHKRIVEIAKIPPQ